MPYTLVPSGTVLSGLVGVVHAQHDQMRSMERSTNALGPTVLLTGLFWNQTDRAVLGDAIMRYNGTVWTLFADPDFAQLNAGGSVAMAANLPAGGFKLTGLGAGSGAGDSVRYEQAVLRNGANALSADLPCGGFKLTGLGDGTNAQDAVSKAQLDSANRMAVFASAASGGPINSTWADGTTTFVQRLQETAFIPERVRIAIKADFIRAETGAVYQTGVEISLDVPRLRHAVDSNDNQGRWRGPVGHWSINGTLWTEIIGTWDVTLSSGASPAAYDVACNFTIGFQPAIDYVCYVRFHTAAAPNRGVEFWIRRESAATGQIRLREVGAGAADGGLARLLVT